MKKVILTPNPYRDKGFHTARTAMKILQKAGLTIEQARRSAIRLALITAPYLYLLPSELLYREGL
jgi:hypothetical protein